MKKLLILLVILFTLMSLSISAAVYLNVDQRVAASSNLELLFSSTTGLYGLEINLPTDFVIVSDPSSGMFENGVYRTTYGDTLKLILRVPRIAGTYKLSGKYTEGEGVYSLPIKNIEVYSSTYSQIECPVCPIDNDWNSCIDGRQSKDAMFTRFSEGLGKSVKKAALDCLPSILAITSPSSFNIQLFGSTGIYVTIPSIPITQCSTSQQSLPLSSIA